MDDKLDFTLWPACVKTHGFGDQLRAAVAGGFEVLPIGPLTWRGLRDSGLSSADIVAMAADQGIRLGHYDGFTDWAPERFAADLPEPAKAVFDVSAEQCLEICDQLGLDAICATGAFRPGAWPLSALVDGFAAFCEKAAAANIRVDLEFIPLWGIPSLALAFDIVRGAGAANGGILFDTWHFFRGDADLALLERIPPGVIRTLQLADGAARPRGESLFEDCLRYRQLPGEGDLDIGRVLRILAAKGGVTSIGPEIFSDELDRLEPTRAGQQTASACARVLRRAGWSLFDGPGEGAIRAAGRSADPA